MKSTFRLFIGSVSGITALCLTVLLSGCGQPGPLYLPKAPPAKPAKSSEAAPVPSTPAPQQ
ncbi:LPS translocon maturation chaperone LptM [Duganella violaceipulchra]|uniref:LPS translocon maturation chaperone LptM n=1 Tax=Duganella violaceipulchra TaxID=2849652 RepID=UPI002FCCE7E7